jgi:hypothetical protein
LYSYMVLVDVSCMVVGSKDCHRTIRFDRGKNRWTASNRCP